MDRVRLEAAELQTRGNRCPIASSFKSEIDFVAQKSSRHAANLKSRHPGSYRLRNTLLATEASLASYCTPKLPANNSIQHMAGLFTSWAVPHLWHALC
jgi:hypothetical protein